MFHSAHHTYGTKIMETGCTNFYTEVLIKMRIHPQHFVEWITLQLNYIYLEMSSHWHIPSLKNEKLISLPSQHVHNPKETFRATKEWFTEICKPCTSVLEDAHRGTGYPNFGHLFPKTITQILHKFFMYIPTKLLPNPKIAKFTPKKFKCSYKHGGIRICQIWARDEVN